MTKKLALGALTALILGAGVALAAPATAGEIHCTPGQIAGPNDWCDTPDPDPETVQEQLPEETQGRAIDPVEEAPESHDIPAPVLGQPTPPAVPVAAPAPEAPEAAAPVGAQQTAGGGPYGLVPATSTPDSVPAVAVDWDALLGQAWGVVLRPFGLA